MSNSISIIDNLFRLYGKSIRGEKRTPPLDPLNRHGQAELAAPENENGLQKGSGISTVKPSASDPTDMVQISPAAKRLQIFRQISSQLRENLTSSGPQKGQEQVEELPKNEKEGNYTKEETRT